MAQMKVYNISMMNLPLVHGRGHLCWKVFKNVDVPTPYGRKECAFDVCHSIPVIGIIPSTQIPIPLVNFGIELRYKTETEWKWEKLAV